jgi:hypothetical protein
MAELQILNATGHTLSFSDYTALKPATQQALHVGGGSDYNDWLLPFVLHILVAKTQANQKNPEILTRLARSNFSVGYLRGWRWKSCQILEVGSFSPKGGLGPKVIVAVAPPHTHDDIAGPEWSFVVKVTLGKLSSPIKMVKVVDPSAT